MPQLAYIITGDDIEGIKQLKKHLFQHFETKNLENLKYFLSIEVAQSKQLSMCPNRNMFWIFLKKQIKYEKLQTNWHTSPSRYQILVDKLLYLTITHPDNSFDVSVVS